jgi:hypothetical protein
VSLSSLAPRWAAAALRVRAGGDIIPERVALGARFARFGYGVPSQIGP